jgi:hypothetical protein
MAKISPPAIYFHSCTGTKPNIGQWIETSRTIPEHHLRYDRESLGGLEGIGSPLATGEDFSRLRLV